MRLSAFSFKNDFIEDGDYSADKASEIVLCKWNRHYPSDKVFDIDLKSLAFKKSAVRTSRVPRMTKSQSKDTGDDDHEKLK